MKRQNLLFLLVCLVLAALILPSLFRSERSRVKGAFHAASEALEKSSEENILVAGLKAKALGELVDGKLRLAIPDLGYGAELDANEVQQQAAYARNQMAYLHVAFHRIDIDFPARGEASATAEAEVSADLDGFRTPAVHAVRTRLRKESNSGKWRFRDVRVEPAAPAP